MALFFECMLQCAQKVLDAADIVRDGDLSPIDSLGSVCYTSLFRLVGWRFYVVSHSRSSCFLSFGQVANPFSAAGSHVGRLRSLWGWREPFPLRHPGRSFIGRASRARVHANRLPF